MAFFRTGVARPLSPLREQTDTFPRVTRALEGIAPNGAPLGISIDSSKPLSLAFPDPGYLAARRLQLDSPGRLAIC
jgi:hypothetical protein